MKFVDLTGKRFGLLFVLEPIELFEGRRKWQCICDCGNLTVAAGSNLGNGHTKSCGCLRRQWTKTHKTTHGMSKTPEHKTWSNIHARCEDPKHVSFKYYGVKGVRVCDRWKSFEAFFEDMGNRPSPNHSLDRINPDGDYCPENCRWATWTQQNNNRRNNRRLTLGGITMSCAAWDRKCGFRPYTITGRLFRGWSAERAITTPLGPKNFGDKTV